MQLKKNQLPLQLPLRDYERAFRVIHSVVEGADYKSEKSCMLMSYAAAYLLKDVYGINAHVVAGAALYWVDSDAPNVAVIGAMREGQPLSDRDNFHVWVESETHVFDFQAPVFREAVEHQINGFAIPRLMFQRGLSEQCDGNFIQAGDFELYPNPDLTRELVDAFFSKHEGPI